MGPPAKTGPQGKRRVDRADAVGEALAGIEGGEAAVPSRVEFSAGEPPGHRLAVRGAVLPERCGNIV